MDEHPPTAPATHGKRQNNARAAHLVTAPSIVRELMASPPPLSPAPATTAPWKTVVRARTGLHVVRDQPHPGS